MECATTDPRDELEVSILEARVVSGVDYYGPKRVRDVWEQQVVPAADECEADGVLSPIDRLSVLAKAAKEVAQTLSRPLRERDAKWFNKQAKRFNKKLGKLLVSHAEEQTE